jgi:hypothetical protein
MQDSAFEFESFDQFSSEAGSTGSAGVGTVRFGPGATVLLVGDSHTVGAFGSELERLLKATGASIVRSAEKGTAVKQWLGRLPPLLKKHAPSIVIVALGANMRDYPYPRATSAQVTKLIAVIRKERPGAALYWIGPPRKRSDTTATLVAFNAILKNGLGSSARFVDSSPHTPKYEGGDGEHYAPTPAKRWAKGVFVELTGVAPRAAPSKAAPPAMAAPAKAAPQASSSVPLGTLRHTSRAGKPWSYAFTANDLEWTARYLTGEAGSDLERTAVLWTLLNRFAFARRWSSFAGLLRAYSTPLQYPLNSPGAALRHYRKCPGASCQYVDLSGEFGYYPLYQGRKIPKGQLRRFIELQRTPWSKLQASARRIAAAVLSGQVRNNVGLATEFDDTAVYWKDAQRSQGTGITRGPTRAEWLEWTRSFAKKKKYLWPSDSAPYDQFGHNVLFVESRYRDESSPVIVPGASAVQPELGEWETEAEWALPPPTGPCAAQWIAFTKKLPPDAKSALDSLDFAGAVAAAIRGGVVSESDLTRMLFYAKYGPTHGYCAVKSGTQIPGGGDSYQKAWEDLQRDYVAPGLAAAPAPVLSLKSVRVGSAATTRPRYLGSRAYQGWYVARADARVRAGIPQSRLVEITGRLQIAESGTPRNHDPKKDKLWPLRGAEVSAVPLTTPSDTARSGTASVVKLARDGSFRASTVVGFDGFPHPFRLQVAAQLANGKVFRTRLELSPVQVDLDRFLSIVGPKEGAVRQSRLEFLASVRKIYQGGPGDPLAGAFDWVLYRNRGVRVLFEQEPAMRAWLKEQEAIYADGELVDIGHVLAGIEGASKQQPSEDQQIPVPVRPDLIVTWAGDLGSVLQHNMAGIVAAVAQNQTPKWEEYLKRAPRSDLVGDIDGVNLGSLYDPNDSLTGNLKAYYGKKSARRFHEFIANTLDIKGKPALPLVVTDKPPRLSEAAWTFIASSVLSYLAPFWITGKLKAGVAPANYPLIDRILGPTSLEMRAVVAHFVRFLEIGLERETWAAP